MLKVKGRKTIIKGDVTAVGAEYAHLTNQLVKGFESEGIPREIALKMVDRAYRLGLKTKEEVDEELKRLVEKMSKCLNEEEENE